MPEVITGQAVNAPNPVDVLSALMDKENVTPDAPIHQDAESSEQPDTDSEPAPEPENNAQVEGADAPDDGGDRPAVAEIPLDQLEAIELETTYKGVDGKDITEKLPIKALREGYMRQQDYQRKTAEVARAREEVATKSRQAQETAAMQYAQQLQALEQAVLEAAAPELKNVNWNDLAENNTFEYVRLSNRANQIKQTLDGIKAKQAEVNTKLAEQRRLSSQETAQKTWQKLEADIPGWNPELYQTTLKAAESVGFTTEEVGAWLDPRAIKLLHKAYQFDQLKVGNPPAEKKVVAVPKVVKPGTVSNVSPKARQQTNALQSLQKNGKVNDLAAFLASKM